MAHSTELFSIEEDPFFVQDLVQMSRAENYRRWQFQMIAPYVSGKVLEVGGGIGNFTQELATVADSVISIEPNTYCFGRLAEKVAGNPKIRACNTTVEALAENEQVDTVVMMNVLEHIKDDGAVLDKLRQRLKPGGRVVLLVPAAPWAFGKLDERLGHYRRYSKQSARILMDSLKLRIETMRYYNFVGLWGWWYNARIGHKESQNDAQIRLFDRYFVPCLRRIERWLHPPVGQTLLVVARTDR
jgi:SAM-dependent methyltransferase